MANILALDDILDAANLIKRILEQKGHSVTVFTEEEDAILHAGSHKVDLVILDMKLKKMNGVDVLRELKKQSSKIRVIMLTGYPTMETAKACLDLGADDYFVKPFENSDLEDKVEELLKKK